MVISGIIAYLVSERFFKFCKYIGILFKGLSWVQ
jgi:hypothetical protein